MQLEIRELEGPLGAEVRGLDLSRPPTDAERAALTDVWQRRHLLLLREQSIDEREQIRFVENFGPFLDESADASSSASYVSNRRQDGFAGDGPILFHSDLAFTPDPLQVIGMYALEVPASGSSTIFANAERAAARLPVRLRERLAGLQARHVFDLVGQHQHIRYHLADFPEAAHAVHPLLWTHPETGVPILFVGQMQTDCILGLPDAEGEALLQELLDALYQPDNLHEHVWRRGDLVVWDNWALQHARPAFDASESRTLRRVVAGGRVVRAYAELHELKAARERGGSGAPRR